MQPRTILLFAWATITLTTGCGENAHSSADTAGSGVLHALHTDAAEPVDCVACHEKVQGRLLPAKSWQCKVCHEDTRLELHAATPTDSDARGCMSCHDFLATDERPVACGTCHEQAAHDPAKPDEDCSTCHRAHAKPSLVSTECESCHDKEVVTGHAKPDIQITGCASCHGYHEKASVAAGRCTNCHRQSRAEVSVNATFEGGHDKCVTCHRPHRFFKNEVIGCRDECHDGRLALSEHKVKKHQGCISCHDNHDVKKSPKRACERCHELVPDHPKDKASKTRCIGCHKPHSGQGAPLAVACSNCHDNAKTDRSLHQGADHKGPRCRNCHEPHAFTMQKGDVGLCQRCHGDAPFKNAKTIHTTAKHSDCFTCHGDTVAHAPAGKRADCATCHEKQAKLARKDHKKCLSCHDPHTAKQKKTCDQCHEVQARTAPEKHQDCRQCHDKHSTAVLKKCNECHADRATGIHKPVKGGCQSCHRPHGPNGQAAPPACTSCHKTALPGLHASKEHKECTTCHRSHGKQPYRSTSTCLDCHKDKKNHEPTAAMCIGCHVFGGAK